MKVISKKNTKRLVKGAIYEVLKINNLKTNAGYFRPFVQIKINDSSDSFFAVSNFKLEDGSEIPEINWESPDYKHNRENILKLSFNNDNPPKVGEYIKYIRKSHKDLEYNNKYKISNVREKEFSSAYGGPSWKVYEIQIEGSRRYYKSHSFIRCSTQEIREISLSDIFGEDNSVKKIDTKVRKIDQYDLEKKERLLTKLLLVSILDVNRNNMSVVEWACKNGSIYSVKKEDFDPIINKSFSEILEKY